MRQESTDSSDGERLRSVTEAELSLKITASRDESEREATHLNEMSKRKQIEANQRNAYTQLVADTTFRTLNVSMDDVIECVRGLSPPYGRSAAGNLETCGRLLLNHTASHNDERYVKYVLNNENQSAVAHNTRHRAALRPLDAHTHMQKGHSNRNRICLPLIASRLPIAPSLSLESISENVSQSMQSEQKSTCKMKRNEKRRKNNQKHVYAISLKGFRRANQPEEKRILPRKTARENELVTCCETATNVFRMWFQLVVYR